MKKLISAAAAVILAVSGAYYPVVSCYAAAEEPDFSSEVSTDEEVLHIGFEAVQFLTSAVQCNCSDSYAGTYTTYDLDAGENLNIRSGHGTTYSILGVIPAGAVFTVTKADGTWAHIEYNGISGYAYMSYMKKLESAPDPDCGCTADYAGVYTTKGLEGAGALNIRAGHSTATAIIGSIPDGAKFLVTKANGTWAHIEYNGISGFAYMDYMYRIADEEPSMLVESGSFPSWFVQSGSGWEISGTVCSDQPLEKVWGGVYDRKGGEVQCAELKTAERTCALTDVFGKTVNIAVLPDEKYTFKVFARDTAGNESELVHSDFSVIARVHSGLMGDLNLNGTIDISDMVILQRSLLGLITITPVQFTAADMTMDTEVNGFDMALLRKAVMNPPEPPVVEPEKPVMLNVMEYCQHPDYPTGCESAALYMLLKYYGVNVTMEQIVTALPKEPLPYYENGSVYGGDPERGFIGDPRSAYSYGVFNEPIAQTAAKFKVGVKTKEGVTVGELAEIVKSGSPVVAWYTTDPQKGIRYNDSWFDYKTGKLIKWPAGEHAVVVCGVDGDYLTYRDPNTGSSVTMTKTRFSSIFTELGGRVVYY